MPATVTEIAREAKVSVSLASRLLRGDRSLKVSPQTHDRVLEVCRRFGGVRKAKAFPSRVCHVVAPINRILAGKHITRYLIDSPMWMEIDKGLRAKGGQLSMVFFDEADRLETLRRLVDSSSYIGGFLFLSSFVDQQVVDIIREHHCPHVCIDPQVSYMDINTICADESAGVRMSIQYLRALGHEQIAYVGPKAFRYPQYLAALAEANMPYREELICEVPRVGPKAVPDDWRIASHQVFAAWCQTHPMPKALYCHNDHIAMGAIEVVRQLGLTPGRDIDIIGYDNLEGQSIPPEPHPILTTVEHPYAELGRHCTHRLLDQILNQQDRIIHEYIPVHMIVRQTTRPLSTVAGNQQEHSEFPVGKEA